MAYRRWALGCRPWSECQKHAADDHAASAQGMWPQDDSYVPEEATVSPAKAKSPAAKSEAATKVRRLNIGA